MFNLWQVLQLGEGGTLGLRGLGGAGTLSCLWGMARAFLSTVAASAEQVPACFLRLQDPCNGGSRECEAVLKHKRQRHMRGRSKPGLGAQPNAASAANQHGLTVPGTGTLSDSTRAMALACFVLRLMGRVLGQTAPQTYPCCNGSRLCLRKSAILKNTVFGANRPPNGQQSSRGGGAY